MGVADGALEAGRFPASEAFVISMVPLTTAPSWTSSRGARYIALDDAAGLDLDTLRGFHVSGDPPEDEYRFGLDLGLDAPALADDELVARKLHLAFYLSEDLEILVPRKIATEDHGAADGCHGSSLLTRSGLARRR